MFLGSYPVLASESKCYLFWTIRNNFSQALYLTFASCERESSLTLKRKNFKVLAMSLADSFQEKLVGTCSYGLLIYKRKGRQKKKKLFLTTDRKIVFNMQRGRHY